MADEQASKPDRLGWRYWRKSFLQTKGFQAINRALGASCCRRAFSCVSKFNKFYYSHQKHDTKYFIQIRHFSNDYNLRSLSYRKSTKSDRRREGRRRGSWLETFIGFCSLYLGSVKFPIKTVVNRLHEDVTEEEEAEKFLIQDWWWSREKEGRHSRVSLSWASWQESSS